MEDNSLYENISLEERLEEETYYQELSWKREDSATELGVSAEEYKEAMDGFEEWLDEIFGDIQSGEWGF